MKRIVILTTLLALWTATASAALIVNTCTSTYQIYGFTTQVSGWDTVGISTETEPFIVVTKIVRNLRNGQQSASMVPALSGDTIEFTIVWYNGGGDGDTVTLTDYIPTGLTYADYISDTEANCDTTTYGTATHSAGKIYYMTNSVDGTDPGPVGNGVITFRVTVD